MRQVGKLNTRILDTSIPCTLLQEPFIDINVGGGEVAGEDPDKLMVWGVTVFGRVCFSLIIFPIC